MKPMNVILDYPDFMIYQKPDTKEFMCLSDGEEEEVELCAELTYDINHDVIAPDEVLIDLFESDFCGEQVSDDCIKYLWFKRKE